MQRNLRRKKFHKTNQSYNFAGGTFSSRDKIRNPIKFRRENQSLKDLKTLFFLKNRPIHFYITCYASIAPVLSDWSNKTSWGFPALKSTSHFQPLSTGSNRSDSSSEANSSFCHRSTLSKALSKASVTSLGYTKCPAQVVPDLLAPAILWDATVRRSAIDQEDLKPYWKSEKRPHVIKWLKILLFISFSKTLLTTERRLTVW